MENAAAHRQLVATYAVLHIYASLYIAPQVASLVTPALPGLVYSLLDANGRSMLFRIVKVLVYII
jgi:hypothetical protein